MGGCAEEDGVWGKGSSEKELSVKSAEEGKSREGGASWQSDVVVNGEGRDTDRDAMVAGTGDVLSFPFLPFPFGFFSGTGRSFSFSLSLGLSFSFSFSLPSVSFPSSVSVRPPFIFASPSKKRTSTARVAGCLATKPGVSRARKRWWRGSKRGEWIDEVEENVGERKERKEKKKKKKWKRKGTRGAEIGLRGEKGRGCLPQRRKHKYSRATTILQW